MNSITKQRNLLDKQKGLCLKFIIFLKSELFYLFRPAQYFFHLQTLCFSRWDAFGTTPEIRLPSLYQPA